jgi:hypothetical protein
MRFGAFSGAAGGAVTGIAVFAYMFLIDPPAKMEGSHWVEGTFAYGAFVGSVGGCLIGFTIGAILELMTSYGKALHSLGSRPRT